MPMSPKRTSHTFRGGVVVASVAAAAILVIPQTSSAISGHADAPAAQRSNAASVSGAVSASGFPTFVHLPDDQVAHPGAANEWWYTVGHISAHGHEYGYEVQLTAGGITQLAITDVTAGKFYTQQVAYQPGQFSVSTSSLDVRMPNASLSGPMNDMHLTATLPEGQLDLHLSAQGPVLYGNGTGLFPFLGSTSYYYSVPDLQTSGTLTLNGETSEVTGKSWLDRQWGDFGWNLNRWTWMGVQLDNGDAINLWDLFDAQGEGHWATVLHSDGSESVVSVNPLADDATGFQTSPTTGQRYAGRWTVEIPSLNTTLTVVATPTLQEIQAGYAFTPGINEADSVVSGVYQGRQITGKAYVEQFGIWK